MSTQTEIKLDMISVYLKNKVPSCEVESLYQDDKQGTHVFQLNCSGSVATVTVSFAFIDDHSLTDILTTMMRHRLESHFRGSKIGNVIIMHDGIMVEANVN